MLTACCRAATTRFMVARWRIRPLRSLKKGGGEILSKMLSQKSLEAQGWRWSSRVLRGGEGKKGCVCGVVVVERPAAERNKAGAVQAWAWGRCCYGKGWVGGPWALAPQGRLLCPPGGRDGGWGRRLAGRWGGTRSLSSYLAGSQGKATVSFRA